MGKPKFKRSIFFIDNNGDKRFLCKILNFGEEKDDLKFIFRHPESSDAIIHNSKGEKYPDESIFRYYGELTYHPDGSVLWKLPKTKKGEEKIVDNPHGTGTRRTRLSALEEWEPIVIGNIIRYQNCLDKLTGDAEILPEHDKIFNGEPFEYILFLGHMKYQSPPNIGEEEFIYRINNIGNEIDMIIWVRKSEFKGELFEYGNRTAINDNNRVRIAEPNLQVDKTGAIEIDIKKFWSAEWHEDVVGDDMIFNANSLRKLSPNTEVCKVYLKNNPFLKQLIEKVGMNKGFAMYPYFGLKKVNIRLVGIVDEDKKGKFLGIGTYPKNS